MKIVVLSSASSIHTIQWARNLQLQGVDVVVISQHPKSKDFPVDIPVYILPYSGFVGYFLNAIPLTKLIKKIQPDLINVHYASGYGTTARLVNFHPYVLSVWGSDVFEFPYRSVLHKTLLKWNLNSADVIASSSVSMLHQTYKFVDSSKNIHVIPFGVDLEKFKLLDDVVQTDKITVGTVKTLKRVYGIDILLEAMAIVERKIEREFPELLNPLQFKIVGGGPDVVQLKEQAERLGIAHRVVFTGEVNHDQVPYELQKLDIYVALSRQESFGVAVIEAQAMGCPVVVSNVGGLPEVVQDKVTGYIVEAENPEVAADAILQLILSPDLRQQMSYNAERFVRENFSWNACALKMKNLYNDTLKDIN